MKTWGKRILSLALSAVLLLGLLCTGAAAAQAPGLNIGVDLNGKAVSFTNAVPEQVGGRTCVPVRPVFEGLGAAVRYVAAEERVVIEKDAVSLSMVMGEEQLTISERGLTVTLPMKGAAYLRGGLVYVPVRPVAEALGCLVGWENSSRTVIIVDPQPLVAEAMEHYQYRLLEGYNAYASRFAAGSWETELTMAMTVTMMAAEIMKLDADAAGVTNGSSQGEMSMNMKLDMTGMADLVALLSASSGGEAAPAMDPAEMVMDLTVDARVDLAGGKIYMLMEGLPEDAGLPDGAWLCMDMDELLAMSGQSADLAQLVELSGSDLDIAAMIASQVRLADVNNRAAAVSNVRAIAGAAAKLLSDSGFTREGQVYTMSIAEDEAELTIRLNVDEDGAVTAYQVDMDMSAALDELTAMLANSGEELEAYGLSFDGAVFTIKAAMDEENNMTAVMEMDLGELFAVKMTMDGKYTATSKTPSTRPPEGAQVVDYVEWLEQMEA